MLGTLWNTALVNPILNTLVYIYQLVGNLGVAIIILTVLIRIILIPVTIPSLKAIKKQRDLQPELDKLKKKFGHDKKKMAELQMELFNKHGINPASGCLTQIAMIVVLIALYGVIRMFSVNIDVNDINSRIYFVFMKLASLESISTSFLYLNLGKPDPFFVLAILSGVTQFIQSKMMMPYIDQAEKAAAITPDKKDDMAYNLQQQMLYTMPVMNFVIGITLPAGVVLYILTTTIFSLVQTYFVSGLGGLTPWIRKLKLDKYIK